MYVWFDALSNYITALGYATQGANYGDYRTENPHRTHLVGKGITRFHAVYWPAILLSAGESLPTRLLVHGYVTIAGEKISKSLGNGMDPLALTSRFGADAVRYYLLAHIRTTGDGDFSIQRLSAAYDNDLVNQLGNLVN